MIREVNAHFDSSSACFTKNGHVFPYEEGLGPYEYLMGALSGCFTSTLVDELEADGIETDSIDVHTWGEKRETVPATLRDTWIELTVKARDIKDRERILSCVERTKEHCSMYQTIKCVSQMHVSCEVTDGDKRA